MYDYRGQLRVCEHLASATVPYPVISILRQAKIRTYLGKKKGLIRRIREGLT